MFTLQISYPVRDTRLSRKCSTRIPQAAPPRAPGLSACSGIPRSQNSVAVLLDFDTKDAATGFLERLRSQVWDKPELIGQLMTAAPTPGSGGGGPRGPGRGLTAENPVVLVG